MSDYKNSRVVITGGAGFIGSNLAIRLVNMGAKVTVIDSFLPGLGGNPYNLEGIVDKINLVRSDIGNLSVVSGIIKESDYVFNLAGNVSHQDSMRDPIFDNAINTGAQIGFLEACRKENPQLVIVFASTRQLYGSPQYLPVDEKHPINPIDVNGINKLAAEYYHSLYSKIYGMKVVSLRLTNTYGPRQLISHARQGFIGWFFNRAVLGENIELFGGGSQVRDFTFVDDVAEAFLLAAKNEKCFGQIFNLSGERASLSDVAEILKSHSPTASIKKVPFPEERKKIDIGDYYGNSEKFYALTRWQPKTNLHDGLKNSLNFYLKNSEPYLNVSGN